MTTIAMLKMPEGFEHVNALKVIGVSPALNFRVHVADAGKAATVKCAQTAPCNA